MVAEPIPITNWADLRNPSCSLCPLHKDAEHVCLIGSGPQQTDYMIIGEAPGAHEDQVSHKPFTGAAGDLLDKCLKEVGLHRSIFFITNSVLCRPLNNRDPENAEIKTCWTNYGSKLLEIVQPKYVLLMGRFALQAILGRKKGITEARGTEFVRDGITFLPTFHTSYALRFPGYKKTIVEDLTYFKRLAGITGSIPDTKPILVTSDEQLDEMVEKLMQSEVLAVDLETQGLRGLDPSKKLWCMSLSNETGLGYVVPVEHPDYPIGSRVLPKLKPLLESKRIKIVGHNYKFDMQWLATRGINPRIDFDTLQAGHLIDENRKHTLKSLAQGYLGVLYWGDGKYFDTEQAPPLTDEAVLYAAKDADYDRQLYFRQREELMADRRLARVMQYITMPAVRAISRIEHAGMPVDVPRLHERIKKAEQERDGAEAELNLLIGKAINWNSPQQVGKVLFGELGLPITAITDTGQASTGRDALFDLKSEHPVIDKLLEYRKWGKILSTYLLPWSRLATEEHPFLHTIYHIDGTVTGRLSSGDRKQNAPNLQNIPRDPFIKGCIGGVPGWFIVEADLSQIELRVAAVLAKDPALHHAFQTGIDVHKLTASRITGKEMTLIDKEERFLAKSVGFGFLYGMGAPKFQIYAKNEYGLVISLDDAKSFRDTYFQLYRALPYWHDHQRQLVRKYGYVRSPLGRIRRLPDIESQDWSVAAEAERQAINSPVQATASDMILLALSMLMGELEHEVTKEFEAFSGDGVVTIATVHDSLVFLIREDMLDHWIPRIKHTMEHLPLERLFGWSPTVPITVEIQKYKYWGEEE
jgi:DNA polymerase-1